MKALGVWIILIIKASNRQIRENSLKWGQWTLVSATRHEDLCLYQEEPQIRKLIMCTCVLQTTYFLPNKFSCTLHCDAVTVYIEMQ